MEFLQLKGTCQEKEVFDLSLNISCNSTSAKAHHGGFCYNICNPREHHAIFSDAESSTSHEKDIQGCHESITCPPFYYMGTNHGDNYPNELKEQDLLSCLEECNSKNNCMCSTSVDCTLSLKIPSLENERGSCIVAKDKDVLSIGNGFNISSTMNSSNPSRFHSAWMSPKVKCGLEARLAYQFNNSMAISYGGHPQPHLGQQQYFKPWNGYSHMNSSEYYVRRSSFRGSIWLPHSSKVESSLLLQNHHHGMGKVSGTRKRGRGSENGMNNVARKCSKCQTTTTPLWRNGPNGEKSLCNACGIRYKKEERRAASAMANTSSSRLSNNHVTKHHMSP